MFPRRPLACPPSDASRAADRQVADLLGSSAAPNSSFNFDAVSRRDETRPSTEEPTNLQGLEAAEVERLAG